MNDTYRSKEGYDEPALYDIRIKGHLDDRWADRFAGLTLTRGANGDTLLTGPVIDQAALYGLLRTVRDLGMLLLSVTRVPSEPAEASDGSPQHSSDHSPEEAQP